MGDDFWDKVRNKIGLAIYEKIHKEIIESINKVDETEEEKQ